MESSERFIMTVPFKKLKLFIHLVIFILLSGCCILMLDNKDMEVMILGLIITLFFIPFTALFFFKSLSRKPAVSISSKGIYCNTMISGEIFIEWNEIGHICMHEYRVPINSSYMKYILIYPLNPKSLTNTQTGHLKIFRYILKQNPLSISEYFIKADIITLSETINDIWKEKTEDFKEFRQELYKNSI